MRLWSPRIVGVCVGAGLVAGGLIGSIVAVASHDSIGSDAAGVIAAVGAVAFLLGMFAAVEPPDGWSNANARDRPSHGGRRSVVTRLAFDWAKEINEITSADLVVWSIVVGGGLIGIAALIDLFAG